ncbi:unnamed protein product [Rhodiola kirilowii]
MAIHLHVILAALCLAFVASQAALPEEVYWNSMLPPNTTMPRAISNVLLPGKGEEIVPDLSGTTDGRTHYGRTSYGRTSYGRTHYGRTRYGRTHYTLSAEEDGEVPDLSGTTDGRTHYGRTSYGRTSYGRTHYGRTRYGRTHYTHGADKNEVLVNPPSAPWFLEKDLYPGREMEMEIARPENNNGYTFIPRQVADSIPFSSDKFPAILNQLSMKPESPKAELMKEILKECELPAEEGEVKTCATSLESMIDFSIQHLGKNIQAVSTEAEKDTKLQKFTVLKGMKQIGKDEAVACHKQNYAYAVFYCHDVKGARAYVVPFVGTSGTKVKAVGICHTNTTTWSPEHEAFKILKVKPGGEPICHFLPEYNVLWTRK